MCERATPQQRSRIEYLLSEVVDVSIDTDRRSLIEEATSLSPSQMILWLELRGDEDWAVTPEAVRELEGLGYASARDIQAASRLASGGPSPAMLIAAIGLRSDRAGHLLEITPPGTTLLSPGDDKAWTKAILALPIEALQDLIADSLSQAALWRAVVSAHNPMMKRRIEKFSEAGAPFIPWIVSGHTVEDLLEVSGIAGTENPSRVTIHKAVRVLDRGLVTEEEQ